jgi:hypothetical protein
MVTNAVCTCMLKVIEHINNNNVVLCMLLEGKLFCGGKVIVSGISCEISCGSPWEPYTYHIVILVIGH